MKRKYGLIVAPPAVILKGSDPQQFSIESLPKQLFQNSVLLFTFATQHLLFLIFTPRILQILNSQEHKVHRTR